VVFVIKLLIVPALIIVLSSCGMSTPGPATVPVSTAAASPSIAAPVDFSLKDLSGKEVTLAEFKGKKAVLLVFWTTWCPGCRAEIPELNKLQQKYKDGDLTILAVSAGEKEKPVRSFAQKEGITYTVLLDTNGETARAFGIVGVPTNLVINKKGEQVYKEHTLPPDIGTYLVEKP